MLPKTVRRVVRLVIVPGAGEYLVTLRRRLYVVLDFRRRNARLRTSLASNIGHQLSH
jgi:hypothetical protein